MNFDDAQTLVSPVRSSNEGSRTPLSNATRTLASIPSSSPITSRPRQGSVSRKRTNEESWGPVEAPQTSPKSARPLRRSVTIASIPEMDQQSRSIPIEKGNETSQTQPSAATDLSPAHGNSFDKEIYEYKQQLELDYQTFEQSLNERDAAADLNVIDWEDLEARYIQEISPCIDREREIMNEFNTRFAVRKAAELRQTELTTSSNSCSICRCQTTMRPNEQSNGM